MPAFRSIATNWITSKESCTSGICSASGSAATSWTICGPSSSRATFVPETKPVDDLLQEMKEKGDHMVLVVDEYGGVSG